MHLEPKLIKLYDKKLIHGCHVYRVIRGIFFLSISIHLLMNMGCSHQDFRDQFSDLDLSKDLCEGVPEYQGPKLSEQIRPVAKKMETYTGIKILEEGTQAIASRAWLSLSAEKTIDVQYFIFSLDNIGLIALDYLMRAADRGVKIRVLVDDIMVEADEAFILEIANHPNIDIKVYNPNINLGKNIAQKLSATLTNFRGINQRMHNKTFIVDGVAVITGGRNVADEYFDYSRKFNFRDRDVLMLGGAASEVQKSFDLYWSHPLAVDAEKLVKKAIKTRPELTKKLLQQYACNPANYWPKVRSNVLSYAKKAVNRVKDELRWIKDVTFSYDNPKKNERKRGLSGSGVSTEALKALINQAKKSIDIQSPYLIVTKKGEKLFANAVKRGVRVRILTNSLASTDGIEAFNGYQRSRSELLKLGVEIYEYRPDAAIRFKIMTSDLQKTINHKPIFGLHAKSMVVDGIITVVGTFNLDPRSANLNTECFVEIHSREISEELLAVMEQEYQPENSWRVTKDFNPDSEAGWFKRFQAWSRWFIPKSVL